MPEETDNKTAAASTGYRISNGPVVRFARSDPKLPNDLPEVIELPRVYGAPLLFAIARPLRWFLRNHRFDKREDELVDQPERYFRKWTTSR